MYQPHKEFKTPRDGAKVWRYIDFAELVNLLNKDALFFASAKALSENDPYEGVLPRSLRKGDDLHHELKYTLFPDSKSRLSRAASRYDRKEYEKQNRTLISSWHINNTDSDAMWRIYSHYQEGIAIQSTVGRLKKSFERNADDVVHIGRVRYVDLDGDDIDFSKHKQFGRFLHKRRYFSYEREVRVMTQLPKEIKIAEKHMLLSGKYVRLDIQQLIGSLYISPKAEDWFEELVNETIKRYDISVPVYKSRIHAFER